MNLPFDDKFKEDFMHAANTMYVKFNIHFIQRETSAVICLDKYGLF